ncbi:erythromycin biosynthesis sensory transduction protein eryC1 [candidate division KSB3 bacterium]|uniref:Erythromycin biosynthesis sensory transduction protein eryC1 n=1 Tax=candidate division KSB3 bacterium TaxID=2044937 RepID=A0A2G6K8K4_9BACT|nr:MAG: erythromycin biosynthesis sensory transduction protein eryC1 [candidate division KSB3 bacterium]
MPEILFGNLAREYQQIREAVDPVVARVLERGWFILGPEVEAFEQAFCQYVGSNYCVSAASGTEALALALMAYDIGSGDEVLTVSHTAVPTATAISMTGAKPVFVDIDTASCLMDVTQLEAVLTSRTRAIIPVHLYGQCVDMAQLLEIAHRHSIPVIEDCAQAHGAKYRSRKAGTMGQIGCFSFYPSKNLGAYGDGGALVTSDPELAQKLRMLRNYGQHRRYEHEIKGINSRLDDLQAAILHAKLEFLDMWNERRRQIASLYHEGLQDLPVITPQEKRDCYHVYHLYVLQSEERDDLQTFLAEQGVRTLIHYPIPVHLQKAYADLGYTRGAFPVTEGVADNILSLPMYPQLRDDEISQVIDEVRRFFS